MLRGVGPRDLGFGVSWLGLGLIRFGHRVEGLVLGVWGLGTLLQGYAICPPARWLGRPGRPASA